MKDIASLISIVCFVLLALFSGPSTQPDNECNDSSNLETESKTGENHVGVVSFKVIDQRSGIAVPNVSVQIAAFEYFCDPINDCPEQCGMKTRLLIARELMSDAEGLTSIPFAWSSRDIKDKLIADIYIYDPSQNYAPFRTAIQLEQTDMSPSFTFRMLNLNDI
jgi:hypothetical protein